MYANYWTFANIKDFLRNVLLSALVCCSPLLGAPRLPCGGVCTCKSRGRDEERTVSSKGFLFPFVFVVVFVLGRGKNYRYAAVSFHIICRAVSHENIWCVWLKRWPITFYWATIWQVHPSPPLLSRGIISNNAKQKKNENVVAPEKKSSENFIWGTFCRGGSKGGSRGSGKSNHPKGGGDDSGIGGHGVKTEKPPCVGICHYNRIFGIVTPEPKPRCCALFSPVSALLEIFHAKYL